MPLIVAQNHRRLHADGAPGRQSTRRERQPAGLVEQPCEDSHQCPLLLDGQASQSSGRRGHAVEEKGTEAGTRRREIQHFHSPVRGRRATAHETARFEPIHEPGHVRRVAGERLGEPAHRDGPAGLDQMRHVTLRRRELKLGGERREVRALREEELDQELPGVAGVGARPFHASQYSSFHK